MKKHSKLYKDFFFYSGFLMLISEIWKQYCLTYIMNEGTYNWWYFPFQLCSIPMYVCLILPWCNSPGIRGVLLAFLMDFGLLGGIFTFFDTSGMYYSYLPLTFHSFAWHILLIFLGIRAGLARESDHSLKGFLKSHAFSLRAVWLRRLSISCSILMGRLTCSISAPTILWDKSSSAISPVCLEIMQES